MCYLCANFSLPRPICSRLRPDVRDRRQTDRRQTASSLNAPPIRCGGITRSGTKMAATRFVKYVSLKWKPRKCDNTLFQKLRPFYARDAMRKGGLCCRRVSVSPSARHVGALYPDGWRYRQISCSAR